MPSDIKSKKRIIIVGAGISGLTAACYLLRKDYDVLILDKSPEWGGLVNSFFKEGFLFDTGPRSIGNAGILKAMLSDLGIELPLLESPISLGVKDRIINYDSHSKMDDYIHLLKHFFPDAGDEIKDIEKSIRKNIEMARTLNRLPNPYFKNPLMNLHYLFSEFLPWLPSFLRVAGHTSIFKKSVEETLSEISLNQSLNDMVSQHFYKGTDAHFALGYFENYLDYLYPLGGTKALPDSLVKKIKTEGGDIQLNTEITDIEPSARVLIDQEGNRYTYDCLLWAADLKSLYKQINSINTSGRYLKSIKREQEKFLSFQSGESVFSIFLGIDRNPKEFSNKSEGHFIYTPDTRGLGQVHRTQLDRIKNNFNTLSKDTFFQWLKEFCRYNSYEISIPVLKDPSLAPKGKTGLIISLLMDGQLVKLVDNAGWYDEFKDKTSSYMIETLEKSIYPGLSKNIIFKKTASPLSLLNRFNSENGAISGWSLENKSPVPDSLFGIASSVHTSIPHVFKAGQWSYCPSGVPIAVLTGRIASIAIHNDGRRLK